MMVTTSGPALAGRPVNAKAQAPVRFGEEWGTVDPPWTSPEALQLLKMLPGHSDSVSAAATFTIHATLNNPQQSEPLKSQVDLLKTLHRLSDTPSPPTVRQVVNAVSSETVHKEAAYNTLLGLKEGGYVSFKSLAKTFEQRLLQKPATATVHLTQRGQNFVDVAIACQEIAEKYFNLEDIFPPPKEEPASRPSIMDWARKKYQELRSSVPSGSEK